VQLLRTHGIDASPVLVTTRDRGTFHSKWHTMSQLNHAIVAVHLATGTVFADASVPSCPFGVLPTASTVAEGLQLARDGATVVTVTPTPVESSRQVITTAELDAEGNLVASSTWTLVGHPAYEARRELERAGAQAFVQGVVGPRFPGATIESVGVGGQADDEAPLSIETSFRVAGWATRQGFDLSCGAPFVFAGGESPLGGTERRIPVVYDYAWKSEESLSLHVPSGLYVPATPAEASAQMREVSFSVRWDGKGTTLEGRRMFRVREPRVEMADVESLQTLYGELAAADRTKFTVKRAPMRASSEAGTR